MANQRDPDKKAIMAWLPKEMHEAFREYCESKSKTMSTVITEMVAARVQRQLKKGR